MAHRPVARRLDPAADPGRRIWVDCPGCSDNGACSPCGQGRTCAEHWRYLLSAARRRFFVQCPGCRHRWWHDSGFGRDDRPGHLDGVPDHATPPRANGTLGQRA